MPDVRSVSGGMKVVGQENVHFFREPRARNFRKKLHKERSGKHAVKFSDVASWSRSSGLRAWCGQFLRAQLSHASLLAGPDLPQSPSILAGPKLTVCLTRLQTVSIPASLPIAQLRANRYIAGAYHWVALPQRFSNHETTALIGNTQSTDDVAHHSPIPERKNCKSCAALINELGYFRCTVCAGQISVVRVTGAVGPRKKWLPQHLCCSITLWHATRRQGPKEWRRP